MITIFVGAGVILILAALIMIIVGAVRSKTARSDWLGELSDIRRSSLGDDDEVTGALEAIPGGDYDDEPQSSDDEATNVDASAAASRTGSIQRPEADAGNGRRAASSGPPADVDTEPSAEATPDVVIDLVEAVEPVGADEAVVVAAEPVSLEESVTSDEPDRLESEEQAEHVGADDGGATRDENPSPDATSAGQDSDEPSEDDDSDEGEVLEGPAERGDGTLAELDRAMDPRVGAGEAKIEPPGLAEGPGHDLPHLRVVTDQPDRIIVDGDTTFNEYDRPDGALVRVDATSPDALRVVVGATASGPGTCAVDLVSGTLWFRPGREDRSSFSCSVRTPAGWVTTSDALVLVQVEPGGWSYVMCLEGTATLDHSGGGFKVSLEAGQIGRGRDGGEGFEVAKVGVDTLEDEGVVRLHRSFDADAERGAHRNINE